MTKKNNKKPKAAQHLKPKKNLQVEDYIEPLYMNGLQGRMLRIPAPEEKKREFLFIYGHHSTIERWWGLIQDLNQYGAVTVPDLPGFGGMETLYKIGQKPDIDTLADYLAAFIKLRYKKRRVSIVGLSFGFVVVTRMLQRYPDIAKKVDMLISVVGFAHYEDFTFTKTRMFFYRRGTAIFSHRLPAIFFKHVMIHPLVLRAVYTRTHNAKDKFKDADKEKYKQLIDFEMYLWHVNDVRTQWLTSSEFLRLNNCTKQLDIPLWHVAVSADRYFDNNLVEQHLKVIFSDVEVAMSKTKSHAPSVIATKEEAADIIPPKLRKALARN